MFPVSKSMVRIFQHPACEIMHPLTWGAWDCPATMCEGNMLEEDRTVHCASCWPPAGIRCWKLRTVWDPA
jgi:hypothetical protein